jgi:hypothetical protein
MYNTILNISYTITYLIPYTYITALLIESFFPLQMTRQ